MTTLRSDAWLLRGISAIPGELALGSAELSFTASGAGSAWPFQLRRLARQLGQPAAETLADGNPVQLFAWPVREIRCAAPWFFFGGGLTLERRGTRLRVGFGEPVGARRDPGAALGGLRRIGAMRALGQQWETTLRQASQHGETGP